MIAERDEASRQQSTKKKGDAPPPPPLGPPPPPGEPHPYDVGEDEEEEAPPEWEDSGDEDEEEEESDEELALPEGYTLEAASELEQMLVESKRKLAKETSSEEDLTKALVTRQRAHSRTDRTHVHRTHTTSAPNAHTCTEPLLVH